MTGVTFLPLTPEQVLAEHPDTAGNPYFLTVHDGGLAMPAGADAWVHATPNGDGSWTARGYFGPLGNTGTPVTEERLDGPDPLYASFCAAANSEADGAYGVISAIAGASHTVRYRSDLRDLFEEFPTLTIEAYGGSYPVQAEGTLAGHPFYFRYRSGNASLKVGGDLFQQSLWLATTAYGDGLQGHLSLDEFKSLFRQLVAALDRAPIYWEFEGNRTCDRIPDPALVNWEAELLGVEAPETTEIPARDRKGAPTSMGAWGHTPAEAWQRLHRTEGFYKITAEQWRAHVAEHGLRPETITADERVFPDADPDWAAPAI